MAFDFLVTEWPEAGGPAHEGTDDYLHEAALADNPDSGTFYDPERDGMRLASLGVHEHWNNPIYKQYSRNLGTGDGIELWKVPMVRDIDFSGDGKINFIDFSILAQYFSQAQSSVDISPQPFGDGIVDFNDVSFFVSHWLTGTKIPPLPGQASNPNPPDYAVYVGTNTDLSWTVGFDAASHDVYFGTSNPPPFIGNQADATFDPGTMAISTTYYWCIDAVNDWGKTTGSVWHFMTVMPPPP